MQGNGVEAAEDVVAVTEDEADAGPQEQLLDPFGFLLGSASVIGGLGGEASPHDPTYAFHTPYVDAAAGPCNFTVRFEGLAARYGTLQLRVHMMSHEPGAIGRMANMDRIALNRLVHQGGHASIRFEGFRGYSFALMGLVPDETDATARGISVSLDRPAGFDADDRHGADGRTSVFGRDTARAATHLISTDPPSFASPVCQVGTARQLREPAFAEWRAALAGADDDGFEGWTSAFVLQALRRYGMLAREARGVGFGVSDPALTNAIRAFGPQVTATCFEGGPASGSRGAPDIPAIAADPIPASLVDFDFCFSAGGLEALDTVGARVRFVEACMAALRPGGLAVYTMPYALADGAHDNARHTAFRRSDIERIALVAISRNHEVAQIKIDRTDAIIDPRRGDGIGVFGIILRRAPAIV